jgi:hypothetical protein
MKYKFTAVYFRWIRSPFLVSMDALRLFDSHRNSWVVAESDSYELLLRDSMAEVAERFVFFCSGITFGEFIFVLATFI